MKKFLLLFLLFSIGSCTIEATNVCYTEYEYELVIIDGIELEIPVPVTVCYY